jgi:hypothetical protein
MGPRNPRSHESNAAISRGSQHDVNALECIRCREEIINRQGWSIGADENDTPAAARAQRGVDGIQPLAEVAFMLWLYPRWTGDQALGPTGVLAARRRDDEVTGPLGGVLESALEERQGDRERPLCAEGSGKPLLTVPEGWAPAEHDQGRSGEPIHAFLSRRAGALTAKAGTLLLIGIIRFIACSP